LVLLSLWSVSAVVAFSIGDWSLAGNIGDSFGAVSALFSGLALALAIYSMILQQQQNAEFQKATLHTLNQQAQAIELIKSNLLQQADAARVAAITTMIERLELRIENLKDWGRNIYNDEKYYRHGIDAAAKRIKEYERRIATISHEVVEPE